MIYPVQSLANMEYMLYGNTPSFGSTAAPSMLNGYCATTPYLTSGYPYYNNMYDPSLYNSSMYNNAYNQQMQNMQQSTAQTAKDIDVIANYYNKASEPSESLISAIISGAAFGAINNPRLLAHPYNSIKASTLTKEMFKSIKEEGSALNKLWINPETNSIIRDAYFRMHKLEARNMSKLGLFRKRYTAEEYEYLKGLMKTALESNDPEEIAKASATLKQAYTNNGPLSKAFGAIKRFFGKTTKPNEALEAIKDTEAIAATKAELLAKGGKMGFREALKHGGGWKGGIFFMGIEFLMSLLSGNITAAFSKDNATGFKQLGQTLVKGAGSAVGWATGEALGVMGAATICAKIGTVISPGLGTAIGGILGLVGGSIGCWLTGKLTHALVGRDVGETVKTEQLKKTPEGQVQLLQLTAQQKNIPLNVQQAMQNVAAQYSAAA